MDAPPLSGNRQPLSLQTRLGEIQKRIERAAQKSGRILSDICLVAVTKTVAVDQINQAIALGIKDIGENKIQELNAKQALLRPGARKHFIGHLQTNKARKAVELCDLIQSVDSERLAAQLNRVAAEQNKVQECLVEVRVSSEATKTGVPEDRAPSLIEAMKSFSHLKLRGCMTIAPFGVSERETRESFQRLKKIFERFKGHFGDNSILSMGMSDDFEWAIEEGSNMVRIGRALFGERNVA